MQGWVWYLEVGAAELFVVLGGERPLSRSLVMGCGPDELVASAPGSAQPSPSPGCADLTGRLVGTWRTVRGPVEACAPRRRAERPPMFTFSRHRVSLYTDCEGPPRTPHRCAGIDRV